MHKRRKRKCVSNVATHRYGKDGVRYYIAEEIRSKGKDEREKILTEMGLNKKKMSAKEGLAMFVDLGITWNLLRKLRR